MSKFIEIQEQSFEDLSFLASFFECSEDEVLYDLISYAVQSVSNSIEEHKLSDIVKYLGFQEFGYDYNEKLVKKFQ